MRSTRILRQLTVAAMAVAVVGLGGCTGDMSDLEQYVSDVKAREGGRIDPLPNVTPYASFAYSAGQIRSPFVAESRIERARSAESGVRPPDPSRNPEYLEGFPLDTLRMVGSLDLSGQAFALVQGQDGLIHRIKPGNYIGQNYGRVTAISASTIELIEIVPDGLGGYLERPAAIALSE